MVGTNVFCSFQIGEGAGYLEDAVVGAGAEGEFVHGHAEHSDTEKLNDPLCERCGLG